ncbi:hypothetical protein FITA111629_03065 [Filibacter tadaridae]|uniref:Uncharacterized protein n=1 Tax=Filibacter tadaridae TaxID=2483811 RepID=A0A3P5X5Y1_9BACL|nr:hypothetical protein FILTAD_02458 [Filibacter tadaridae]
MDPDDRKWTMEDLGLSWEAIENPRAGKKEIEGTFYVKNGKICEWSELPNHCKKCLDPLDYNDEFDSVFCPSCNEWREASCSDPTCEYCLARPAKPSDCQ